MCDLLRQASQPLRWDEAKLLKQKSCTIWVPYRPDRGCAVLSVSEANLHEKGLMHSMFPAISPRAGKEQPLGPSHPPCPFPEHQQLPWPPQAQKQSFQQLHRTLEGTKHLDLAPRGPARDADPLQPAGKQKLHLLHLISARLALQRAATGPGSQKRCGISWKSD